MRLIRGLIYRLGFRPKPGSVFYSPPIAYLTAPKEIICDCSIHDITGPFASHANDCPMYD